MCRWFAYISPTEPCLLEDVLITPKHSLAKQVHEHYLPGLLPHDHTTTDEDDMKARNIIFNVDGLGIGWYTSSNSDFERGNTGESSDGTKKEGLRPAVYKTVQPPINDMNFRSICANIETRVLFAHIRAASSSAITPVNNHPFVFGRHSLMHNGVISDFTPVRRELSTKLSDIAFANVYGSTDSEHLAALYMTYLTASSTSKSAFEAEYSLDEMVSALHRAVATVINLQRTVIGDDKRKPNSLNLCATDGVKLVAYRFRNHATSQPPSLYYSTKAGTTLNRKYPGDADGRVIPGLTDYGLDVASHGKHLIVASEPSTYKTEDWELIGRNQYLAADGHGRFDVKDAPYEKEWDAGNS